MAEFISLYSGSSGNSSVVRCGSRYLIVDMGKGVRTTSAALKALGLAVSDCDGILVTHTVLTSTDSFSLSQRNCRLGNRS